MESLTIEIINPKAKKLLEALEDLNLISISQNLLQEEEEWNKFSIEQKQGIFDAAESIDAGKGISHSDVMARFKKQIND